MLLFFVWGLSWIVALLGVILWHFIVITRWTNQEMMSIGTDRLLHAVRLC